MCTLLRLINNYYRYYFICISNFFLFIFFIYSSANKREYDTYTLMCDATTVGQQLGSVAIFVLFFIEVYTDEAQWSVPFLLSGLLLLTLAGLSLRLYADVHFSGILFSRVHSCLTSLQ